MLKLPTKNETAGYLAAMLVFSLIHVGQAQEADSSDSSRDNDRRQRYAQLLVMRYDENKDGSLDRREWEAIRGPRVQWADRDGDGKLSANEIVSTLKPANRSTTETAAESKNAQVPTEVASREGQAALRNAKNYADQLLKQYDEDNDGSLDEREVGQMRRPPRADADENRDKRISRDELIHAIINRQPDRPAEPNQSARALVGNALGNMLGHSAATATIKAADLRTARVQLNLLQLPVSADIPKLKMLADNVSSLDQQPLELLQTQLGDTPVLSNNQVFVTLLHGRQFEYTGATEPIHSSNRPARSSRDKHVGDVAPSGFSLVIYPDFQGEVIRFEIDIRKSFNADQVGQDAQHLSAAVQSFEMETTMALVDGGANASLFAGEDRIWLLIVTANFD